MPTTYKRNCDYCGEYYEKVNVKRFCSVICLSKYNSERMKGRKLSEETKRKMSISLKGRSVWNKGLPFPNNRKGCKLSEETKRKISEVQKGKHIPEITRKKISEKMKIVMLGNNNGIGHIITKEHRHKLNIAKSQKIWSDDERRVMSENSKRYWDNLTQDQKEAKIIVMHRGLHKARPSSIEIAIAKVLDIINEPYEQNKYMFKFYADFYLPNRNLVIECNGEYWHNLPRIIERDDRFKRICESNGIGIIF